MHGIQFYLLLALIGVAAASLLLKKKLDKTYALGMKRGLEAEQLRQADKKIFGLQQAEAAYAAGNGAVGGRNIMLFACDHLGYKNTVAEEIGARLTLCAHGLSTADKDVENLKESLALHETKHESAILYLNGRIKEFEESKARQQKETARWTSLRNAFAPPKPEERQGEQNWGGSLVRSGSTSIVIV